MDAISLITKDSTLKKELSDAMPKKIKVSVFNSTVTAESLETVLFFDVDSFAPALMEEYSGDKFVISVTKQHRTGYVMEAAAFGAYDVIQRPLEKTVIEHIFKNIEQLRAELAGAVGLPEECQHPAMTCAIVGHSHTILGICKRLAQIAQADIPVLITGETGTGKELVAEAIEQQSLRFGKPFVVVNCAAIPEHLLESELFGYEKGAFTGAASSKEGLLKLANEGCIFFDEVGELPLLLQGKLLRFLQAQTFYPLGSAREVRVDVRVISATNRNLPQMVREGKFRQDLYYRLRVGTIQLPPLRERKDDILPLVCCFINRYQHSGGKMIKGMTQAFIDRLLSYGWPGNIRELENTIRYALAFSKTSYLTTHELRELEDSTGGGGTLNFHEALASLLTPFLKEAFGRGGTDIYDKIHAAVDKQIIDYTLSRTNENISEAARILGINRLTLRKKAGISR